MNSPSESTVPAPAPAPAPASATGEPPPPCCGRPVPWLHFLLLAVGLVVHAWLVIRTWGATYWDFGDGNYLYISRRLTEGIVLYRDILAPQPPLHLLLGRALVHIGDAIWGTDGPWWFAHRAASLLIRTVTAGILFSIARAAFGCATSGLLAALLWLFLPIGFWWQLGYQSEPLEILFLLLAVRGVWTLRSRPILWAGVASALAVHTNMTGAPYMICNLVFLACRRPRLAVPYLGSFSVVYLGGALTANAMTDGQFWDNVIFNQTGTFPPPPMLWGYLADKLPRMVAKVFDLEGIFLLAAVLGVLLHLRQQSSLGNEETSCKPGNSCSCDLPSVMTDRVENEGASVRQSALSIFRSPLAEPPLRAEYLAWTAIGSWLSIGFTAKGGTMDYIFTIGEPFVALFAAWAALWLWRTLRPAAGFSALRPWNTLPFLRLAYGLALFLATLLVTPSALTFLRLTLHTYSAELSAEGVARVSSVINHYTKPGDAIISPPWYVVATDRRLVGDYSEIFIWTIKYHNEAREAEEAREAVRRAGGDPATVVRKGPGTEKIREMATKLLRREVPLVILDDAQTGKLPEIQYALSTAYQKAEPEVFQTLNTPLSIWVPKGRVIDHKPITRAATDAATAAVPPPAAAPSGS